MEQDFFGEAKRIVAEADKNSVPVRLMGATAIMMRSSKFSSLLQEKMDRKLSDLDFMALSRNMEKVIQTLRNLGYEMDRAKEYLMTISGRCIFEHPESKLHVDVFFDKLAMCHTIDFTKRLTVDPFTISLADLLLEKMQIVRINEKDIKDVILLLREQAVANTDSDSINEKYVAKLLSKDWGFYYTVTENLKKVKLSLGKYDALQSEDRIDIMGKIDGLLGTIESESKSIGWRMRASIGTKQKWFNDVEEVPEATQLDS